MGGHGLLLAPLDSTIWDRMNIQLTNALRPEWIRSMNRQNVLMILKDDADEQSRISPLESG